MVKSAVRRLAPEKSDTIKTSKEKRHSCVSLQKCFHNRNASSLKSKTDSLTIPEMCDFGLNMILPNIIFCLNCFPLNWNYGTENKFQ